MIRSSWMTVGLPIRGEHSLRLGIENCNMPLRGEQSHLGFETLSLMQSASVCSSETFQTDNVITTVCDWDLLKYPENPDLQTGSCWQIRRDFQVGSQLWQTMCTSWGSSLAFIRWRNISSFTRRKRILKSSSQWTVFYFFLHRTMGQRLALGETYTSFHFGSICPNQT